MVSAKKLFLLATSFGLWSMSTAEAIESDPETADAATCATILETYEIQYKSLQDIIDYFSDPLVSVDEKVEALNTEFNLFTDFAQAFLSYCCGDSDMQTYFTDAEVLTLAPITESISRSVQRASTALIRQKSIIDQYIYPDNSFSEAFQTLQRETDAVDQCIADRSVGLGYYQQALRNLQENHNALQEALFSYKLYIVETVDEMVEDTVEEM